MGKKLTHIHRTLTAAQQADEIRTAAKRDFPPKNRRGLAHFAEPWEQNVPVPFSAGGSRIGCKTSGGEDVSPPGIPARIRSTRNARGLTLYAVGQLAGAGSVAAGDIERSAEVSVSQLRAVASVLGLTIELVEQAN